MGGGENWLRMMSIHGTSFLGCINRETITVFLAKEFRRDRIKKERKKPSRTH
jgi:hypothetical protein